MECYSPVKRKEVLMHVVALRNLKNRMFGYRVSVWEDENRSGEGW